MANITGFRIDTDVTFSFDTGGAVPPPGGGGIVTSNTALVSNSAGTPVVGDATMEDA